MVLRMLGKDHVTQGSRERLDERKERKCEDNVNKMNETSAREKCEAAITEKYPPARINKVAGNMGMIFGLSLGLTTEDENGEPWNFTIKQMHDTAKKIVRSRVAL